ncbi:DUF423 domain-containing protein [Shinella sp.]|uniref:DUF423 domain-containing protein n=1 Tax=Shinella sp. TaxID=1870904 RepID=UPI0028B24F1D|nr:DUF423 domain-containing protein [Shinella sp.]
MSFSLRSASLLVAGLMGLTGVVTAAAASHGTDPRLMAGASAMCMAHAPALVALYAAWPSMRAAPFAAILLALGTALFAGDLVFRHSTGYGLFPMSAPTGGVIMMAGWLTVALAPFLPKKDG